MSGGVWVASYVVLWLAVCVLALAVVVLLRQIGVLHARLQPTGVHPAGEGPEIGRPAPAIGPSGYPDDATTLVVFTSPGCDLCAALRPALATVEGAYPEVRVAEVDAEDGNLATFRAFGVSNTPYVVAVDAAGVVRGKGVANTLDQLESMLGDVLGTAPRVEL